MVIIVIDFVTFESLMLHAKFQGHQTSGFTVEHILKIFIIFGHGASLAM